MVERTNKHQVSEAVSTPTTELIVLEYKPLESNAVPKAAWDGPFKAKPFKMFWKQRPKAWWVVHLPLRLFLWSQRCVKLVQLPSALGMGPVEKKAV
jgi:hypothetical protein